MLTKGVSFGNSLWTLSFDSSGMLIRALTRGPIGGSSGLLLDMGRFCRSTRMCDSAGEKASDRCGQKCVRLKRSLRDSIKAMSSIGSNSLIFFCFVTNGFACLLRFTHMFSARWY